MFQNESSQKLLSSIGVSNTSVIGDTRIDRVLDILNQNNTNQNIEKFIQNNRCFVIGSSWPRRSWKLFQKTVDSTSNLKTIIAPHNIDEDTLIKVEQQFKQPLTRWSSFINDKNKTETNILLVDCIGILTSIYSYADFAYVGGGMGSKGLHNTLEPAVFGIPVIIGKNYNRYQEAADLVKLGGIKSVDSGTTFEKYFLLLLNDSKKRKETGTINLNYIKKQAGATAKILKKLKEVLKR